MARHGQPLDDAHRAYWEARCGRLAFRVFVGRVLEALGPAVLAGSIVASCCLLFARLEVIPTRAGPLAAWTAPGLAAIGALAFAFARGWPRRADMRVRIEEALRLHNRLSSAAEGAAPWPPPPGANGGPAADRAVVTWRWKKLLPLPLASLALLATAIFLPVHPPSVIALGPTQKPPTLERLQEIVKQLAPTKTIDDRTLEELSDQIEQLASRDPEGWYTHAGLEAAESLLQQTENGLSELAGNFSAAANAIDQSASASQGDGHDVETPAGLEAALHGMERGQLPAAGELRRQIREAAAGQLDPAKMKELADKLRDNSGKFANLANGGYGVKHFAQLGAGSTPGQPYGSGGGQSGNGDGDEAGSGGVSRGPGTAPLTLAQNATTAETGAEGALEGLDPERAALGDVAGQSFGRHTIDRAVAEQPAEGGAISTPGTGGEATWTQRLTPEERRAVERTFE